MNFRNTPIDKRRLKAEDRGFDTSNRQKAVATTRARRGQLKYQENRPMNTTGARPGSGGFTGGRGIQQQRMRDIGTAKRRSQELKSDIGIDPVFKPSSRPEDPLT
jgi:hypothetical protein